MPTIHDPSHLQYRRARIEWLVLGLVLSLAGAMFGWMLSREHDNVEAQEGDRLQTQARVIDENLIRQLEGASKALDGIRADLKRQAPGVAAPQTSDKLKLLSGAMPGVSTLLVLDAGGTIVASSRDDILGKNFKQRDYFDGPRRSGDPSLLFVSPPFKTSVGTSALVVARTLTDAEGRFAGVVAAALDQDYFKVVLRSVLYAPDMRTTLIHGEGQVVLDLPSSATLPDLDRTRADAVFENYRQRRQSAALLAGSLFAAGETRLVAMRSIDRGDLHMDKPMLVAVSREVSALHWAWRERAVQVAAMFAVLAAGSGFALYFNQLRRQSLEQVEVAVGKERQLGAERIELALRGADLGLWDLHVPSNGLVVNARERALLGYSAGDELPQGRAWRRLIHPDDLAHVDASILPHLRGETANYECEHRMRHKDGRWLWISNRAMIVERDAAGAPLRIVGTHMDVTERRRVDSALAQAGELLRDSEEQLRQVTDNMPALVSRVDTDLRFRFVNRAYRDWLHIEPAAMLGRSLSEVYGERAFSGFSHHVEAALAGQRVVYERELDTPDGPRRVEVILVPQCGPGDTVQGYYALMSDITARFRAETRLARSEERLSLALEGSGLALFDWDVQAGRMYQSAQASAMRGESAVETTTSVAELQSFVHPEDLPAVLERMKAAVTGATVLYDAEFRLRRQAGDWVWIRARGRVVERDSGGRALRLAGTYTDIDERKLAEVRLRQLAEIDLLTGLPNRSLFQDRLQQAMVRAQRGKPMALLFLDIDHFKAVNDSLGHEAGDGLLKLFADRMRCAVRLSDTLARLGGDEFTVILESLNDVDDAAMLANKLVGVLSEPLVLNEQALQVTASIGVALCLPGEVDEAALLRRADAALYEAKRRGRNGYFCDQTAVPESARDMG